MPFLQTGRQPNFTTIRTKVVSWLRSLRKRLLTRTLARIWPPRPDWHSRLSHGSFVESLVESFIESLVVENGRNSTKFSTKVSTKFSTKDKITAPGTSSG